MAAIGNLGKELLTNESEEPTGENHDESMNTLSTKQKKLRQDLANSKEYGKQQTIRSQRNEILVQSARKCKQNKGK